MLQKTLSASATRWTSSCSALAEANERRLARGARDGRATQLAALQEGNEKKLEQMRATVDEKLQATLEQRLGESFKQVADRLEQVHKGLGEMQTLARDVGSLNRVLTNVKTRGIFGEVQLGGAARAGVHARAVREATSRPCRAATSASTSRSACRAARDDGAPLWLPIDCQVPARGLRAPARRAGARRRGRRRSAPRKAIETRLRAEARTIREKYLAPPHTTDFAILFVPTEGLYAEALRRPGLVEALQREHRVMLAGPTTLLATLNSLQMGFRTLALEQRSAEVWEVLGAVKTEFAQVRRRAGARRKKKLDEAQQHDRRGRDAHARDGAQPARRRGAARRARAGSCCRGLIDGATTRTTDA